MLIDDGVLAAARELAAVSGRSLGAVVSELAADGLASRRAQRASRGRVPVFAVGADDPIVTSDDVAQALDDA